MKGRKMVTYVLTEEKRDNFSYMPENSEDGIPYTWNDLMSIAKGNEKVAYYLYCTCNSNDAWAYPETYLDQDLRDNEIIEDEQGNYHINPQYDFDLVVED